MLTKPSFVTNLGGTMSFRAFQVVRVTALATLMLALSGCTFYITKSKYAAEQKDPNTILVFGYLDDSEAPFKMKEGQLKQVRPTTKKPYKTLRSDNRGVFYLENLPVGAYELSAFQGPDRWILSNAYWTWSVADKAGKPEFEKMQVRADTPGLYYMGSYRIDKVKDGGLFGFNKYATIPADTLTEKEVLEKLVKYVKGTKWESRVRDQLSSLK